MSDNLKMILRYVFTMLATTATSKGWLHVADSSSLVNGAIDVVTSIAALAPMVWAARNVNNAPKPAA